MDKETMLECVRIMRKYCPVKSEINKFFMCKDEKKDCLKCWEKALKEELTYHNKYKD